MFYQLYKSQRLEIFYLLTFFVSSTGVLGTLAGGPVLQVAVTYDLYLGKLSHNAVVVDKQIHVAKGGVSISIKT